MKFDIFDPLTWGFDDNVGCNVGCACNSKKATGRAMGNVGNFIGRLDTFERELRASAKNEEYSIAQKLKESNSAAFEAMGISYHFPDENVEEIFRIISSIKKQWNDRDNREKQVKSILHSIQQLKPFFKGSYQNFEKAENAQEYLDNFKKIKVDGNAAWKVYLNEVIQKNCFYNAYTSVKDRLNAIARGEENPQSSDFEDEPVSSDFEG